MAGAEEFFVLAREFEEAGPKVAAGLFEVFKSSGDAFAKDWADNARETSGSHAAKYPDSISSEMRVSFGLVLEVGPEDGPRNQGFLGPILEFGGEHSPAHLDGARALPIMDRRLERGADTAIGFAIP